MSEPIEQVNDKRGGRRAILAEHSGLVLTGIYILLSAVGFTYNHHLFRRFGVSIADYSETSDFLLAAFREPFVIGIFLLSMAFVWLVFRWDKWMRRYKFYAAIYTNLGDRFIASDTFNIASLALFALIYGWALTNVYAGRVAHRIRAGEGRAVQVELSAPSGEANAAASVRRTLLLGTTSNYVFLYYPDERRTEIVPVESISRMIVPQN